MIWDRVDQSARADLRLIDPNTAQEIRLRAEKENCSPPVVESTWHADWWGA